MENTSTENPIDVLINFGTGEDGLILIGIPVVILLIVIVVFAIIIKRKHAQEEELLYQISDGEEETDSEDSEDDDDFQFPEAEAETPEPPKTEPAKSWLDNLRFGLSKTRNSLKEGISSLFSGKNKLDEETLEKLHEILYRADIGVEIADLLIEDLKAQLKDNESLEFEDIAQIIRSKVSELLDTHPAQFNEESDGPTVLLVVGVNGVGKTTSIGKLASQFKSEGKSVLLCAADTFRAAAIDQLKVWGERLEIDVIAQQQGSDPAAVAFDGVNAAKARKSDIVIIDTAGRLSNKKDLMDELAKIKKVINKALPGAPHNTWIVLDATTGQNANLQAKAFQEATNVDGAIVTKLDGTAKGGVIIGVSHKYQLPIHYIGVGEQAEDLQKFSARDFSDSLI